MWHPDDVTPLNDCIQKSSIKHHSWLKSKWSRIQCVSRKKIDGFVWTKAISWTIPDDWQYKVYEEWASFWKSSLVVWSNGNLLKMKKHWTSSRGGATMQTSPCRVFKSPSLSYPWWRSPDKVRGGFVRGVNESSNVCIQDINGQSDFVWASCDCLSPG